MAVLIRTGWSSEPSIARAIQRNERIHKKANDNLSKYFPDELENEVEHFRHSTLCNALTSDPPEPVVLLLRNHQGSLHPSLQLFPPLRVVSNSRL